MRSLVTANAMRNRTMESRKEAAHGQLVSPRAVAAAEKLDHGNGQASDDEASGIGEHLPVGGDAVALVRIIGHDAVERGIGDVVGGVDEAQQQVSGPGVNQLAHGAEVGRGEGENADDAEGHRCPQQPWTEAAPACLGAVGNDAHDGIEAGRTEADDEEHEAGLRRVRP